MDFNVLEIHNAGKKHKRKTDNYKPFMFLSVLDTDTHAQYMSSRLYTVEFQ